MTILGFVRTAQTTTTTGSGDLSLTGSIAGYQDLADVLTDQDVVTVMVDDATTVGDAAANWEELTVTYNDLTTDTLSVIEVRASTNGGSKISWGGSTKNVFIVEDPERVFRADENDTFQTTNPIELTDGTNKYRFDVSATDLRIRLDTGGGFGTIARYDLSSTFWSLIGRVTSDVEFDAPVLKLNETALGTSSIRDTGTTEGDVPLIGSGDVVPVSIVPAMVGATSGDPGTAGKVPVPAAGDQVAVLSGAATYIRPARTVKEPWRTSWAASTEYSWSHGLGSKPDIVFLEVQNTTTEHGFTVGDEEEPAKYIESGATQRGYGVRKDATDVTYRISSGGLAVINASFVAAALTPASWKIRIVALLYSDVS